MTEAAPNAWVNAANASLLTDLYQLTMLQAYWKSGMSGRASFSLFARRLPEGRNYLLACGQEEALRYLESLQFSPDALAYLRERDGFDAEFCDWLGHYRFRGEVWAVPEGTPVFAGEPILEITASLPQAQLPETFLLNQIQLQTLLASKASRVVHAAGDRPVIDFGLRRTHGADAGLKSARAFFIAGVAATSNVLAGQQFGIPIAGTMAHSFVQAFDDESEAFRTFAAYYPDTTLLVDTYDALEGVRQVAALPAEYRVAAVRLDSGDLAALSRASRAILDAAGRRDVRIFASGDLDEWKIRRLREAGAPIDGFGVGTRMGVSRDAPSLDIVYKLVEYAGTGRVKLSDGKEVLPGRKQVYRVEADGRVERDVLATADEAPCGRPLLRKVMEGGRRLPETQEALSDVRAHAASELARLPERVRGIDPAAPPFPVERSAALARAVEGVRSRVA